MARTTPQPAGLTRRATDQVFQLLRDRIISGELPAGARVEIDAIAYELAISRTPVREAVLQLESAGLVERLPYKGSVVTGVNPARFEEVTALRIQAEGLAAGVGAPRLTDGDIAEMTQLQERIEALSGDPAYSLGLFNDLNRRFHHVLYAAADSPLLLQQIEQLTVDADRIRIHFNIVPVSADEFHQPILAACRARDGAAARELTRRHILHAYFVTRARLAVGDGVLRAVLDETGTPLPA